MAAERSAQIQGNEGLVKPLSDFNKKNLQEITTKDAKSDIQQMFCNFIVKTAEEDGRFDATDVVTHFSSYLGKKYKHTMTTREL